MKKLSLFLILLLIQAVNKNDNLILTHDGTTLASVNRAAFTSTFLDEPVIDEAIYNEFLEKLDKQFFQEPVNAHIDEHGAIVPGKIGYKLDRQSLTNEFYAYFFSRGPAQIEIPKLVVYPKVDSELLATIRVQQISSYVTYFNKNNDERSHNIALAAEAINNDVVFPGEIFSFNKAVGERTLEKGYLPAPVIVKGELYEGIGGGICQVSSTLFNAVDRAGVQIIQRYSHSRRVPYVPPGRDATVSWYGPDFTFKNIHNQPLLIQAKAVEGKVVISVYSSDVINVEPRNVPKAPEHLPEEIRINF
ncbi:Vancomycin resistance protein YoaR, contains peptidoglycan-binding and VanW domains [Evansella caseinilytica]|uniref:Vancomycin resistance protein YoaR, contains peptidoglycan-binding and VanW domains n=1 Tax=Evansella caseinilytica TaxID=1503961 RepID=A0A1H3KCL2_9BACI|nr:VanW family protein [Evansella caseinilytica]SDY49679.1 Vancomycin resistance protein YoaR, contains peptidoglycan-binding and VanW domains [Evansella caseinilytica]